MMVRILTATIAAWASVLPILLLQPSSGSQEMLIDSNAVANQATANQTASASETDREVAELEQSILEQINQHRAERGLGPLALDPELCKQARSHSQSMAEQRSMNHNGFDQRMATVSRSMSYSNASENVAYNQGYPDPDDRAVVDWINSPEHRQNIEGEFNLTGIGIVRNAQGEYYFTQIFVLR